MKGLQKASKTHAQQAKILKSVLKNGKKILKLEQVRNQKVRIEDYTRMRIQKIPSVSNSPQKQTQGQQLQRLKESINLMRERYKYLQSVNKEQK